ncbi:MATE family efflux transporter [Streptococcus moroccensis]|uniref:MATE family efflux protein n=1 Tax=Streptococcus moroccensis TaxID=1451356 RepID=A0ABT9YNV4_9STRE|nr:MATE family efflux transporter [Streptococcus moroccensis]MDQ0221666.1 putative MATE family efflux protein [Streptococcus moroccensis]
MNFLTGNIKKIYRNYLLAAFGSTMIVPIYGIVDAVMVGQSVGAEGVAAMSIIAPMWNIIFGLGIWAGVGGGVLLGVAKGKQNQQGEKEAFSTALIEAGLMALFAYFLIGVFDQGLLRSFGADQVTLPLATQYVKAFLPFIPFFLFNQVLAAFLRNDNAPTLATFAVLGGGLFNVIGDYVFIFIFDMGMTGAALATSIGAIITFIIMLTHFARKNNSLKWTRPQQFLQTARQITTIGFPTFFVDLAMGILTVMFNRQISSYLGTNALAVYGIIVNVSTLVQACAYSIGQASQPIMSQNFGGKAFKRVNELLRYTNQTAISFALFWTAVVWLFPTLIVKIFMTPTPEILAIAPAILRVYAISFLLLPLNIYATYFFQAILKQRIAFVVSVARGMIISALMIYSLPFFFGGNALWWAMPITELLIAIVVIYFMKHYSKQMKKRY